MKKFKIVAISDTHGKHNTLNIPECDFLIHAGDYSSKGYEWEVRAFYKWLNKQNAGHIISIQGNHEVKLTFEEIKKIALEECPSVILLNHESIEIEGVKIFGSPWTPWFYDWAYNGARSPEQARIHKVPLLKDLWEDIPKGTDIVVTHGPPHMILDQLLYVDGTPKNEFVGCQDLAEKLKEIKPDLHIFGHIHCGFGQKHEDGTSYYNASVCDEMYCATNGITIIEYEKED